MAKISDGKFQRTARKDRLISKASSSFSSKHFGRDDELISPTPRRIFTDHKEGVDSLKTLNSEIVDSIDLLVQDEFQQIVETITQKLLQFRLREERRGKERSLLVHGAKIKSYF